jgi:hypothetical protein
MAEKPVDELAGYANGKILSADTADPTGLAWVDPSGAVDSVNGATGVVVLDADDIDDAATANKFATSAELSKLAGIEAGAQVNTVTSVASKTGAVTLANTDISGLGGAATLNVGTTAGTVAAGDDSRLSDARTPTAHGNEAHTSTFITAAGAPVQSVNGDTGTVVLDAADVGAVPSTLVDAKGDLIVATADNTVARLPVGVTTGHVLTVDPAETSGLKWAAGGGGGGGVAPLLVKPGGVNQIGLPGFFPNATGTFGYAANTRWDFLFPVTGAITVSHWAMQYSAGGPANYRVGCYTANANGSPVGAPLWDKTYAWGSTPGTYVVELDSPVTLQPGWYVLSWVKDASATEVWYGGVLPMRTMVAASGTNVYHHTASVAFTYGALPTNPTAGTFATGTANSVTGTQVTLRWTTA